MAEPAPSAEPAHAAEADLLPRLTALEERVAFQDATIDDLNATITAQWTTIDTLMRRLTLLDDRVHEAEARVGAVLPQAPPPHY